MPPSPIGRLHVLTDFLFQQRFTHAELARLACRGGADTVQFRHKGGSPRHRWAGLVPTVGACRDAGVPCIVDDHLDLALAAGADGVHLGQTDLPLQAARAATDRMSDAELLVGATVSTVQEAAEAEAEGVDYLGFGPVFATRSKFNRTSVRGLVGLRAVADAVSVPVIAIAGLTPDRVGACLDAGAHGVAVMTAVTCAEDPERATAAFRDALERAA